MQPATDLLVVPRGGADRRLRGAVSRVEAIDGKRFLCIISYMYDIRRTSGFIEWLSDLTDVQARARIAKRIDRLAEGNFDDHKSIGHGVSELRFTFGPGYRVYYTVRGQVVIILLCGGDKGSQQRDIDRAIAMAKEV